MGFCSEEANERGAEDVGAEIVDITFDSSARILNQNETEREGKKMRKQTKIKSRKRKGERERERKCWRRHGLKLWRLMMKNQVNS